MQWMRDAIPSFWFIIHSLQTFLRRVYARGVKRTKLTAAKVLLLSLNWSFSEAEVFEKCETALEHQVTLAHRDSSLRSFVYTDASDLIWSDVVTQVRPKDLSKSPVDQRYRPLYSLSGHFYGLETQYSTLEKEAYAIMKTVQRMHVLLATCDGFDLFADHHNLVFLFDPLFVVSDLFQTTTRKLLLRAVLLTAYNYTCVHIKGFGDVWADVLSRWTPASNVWFKYQICPHHPRRSLNGLPLPRSSLAKISLPMLFLPTSSHLMAFGRISQVPSGSLTIATFLQLRLCIIAHTGPSSHLASISTDTTVWKSFFWSTITADVLTFVHFCSYWLLTTGGGKVPHRFSPSFDATMPSVLLQLDYIETAASSAGEKYVLMLRDDHSDYKWFFAFPNTAAQIDATAIIDWSAAFSVPNGLISDGPTHFKNDTTCPVARGLKIPRHFTLLYFQKATERLNIWEKCGLKFSGQLGLSCRWGLKHGPICFQLVGALWIVRPLSKVPITPL